MVDDGVVGAVVAICIVLPIAIAVVVYIVRRNWRQAKQIYEQPPPENVEADEIGTAKIQGLVNPAFSKGSSLDDDNTTPAGINGEPAALTRAPSKISRTGISGEYETSLGVAQRAERASALVDLDELEGLDEAVDETDADVDPTYALASHKEHIERAPSPSVVKQTDPADGPVYVLAERTNNGSNLPTQNIASESTVESPVPSKSQTPSPQKATPPPNYVRPPGYVKLGDGKQPENANHDILPPGFGDDEIEPKQQEADVVVDPNPGTDSNGDPKESFDGFAESPSGSFNKRNSNDIANTTQESSDSIQLEASRIEELKRQIGPVPEFAPPLPPWMEPDNYDPWATARKRPMYRTVVGQRDKHGDLGFSIVIKNGTDLVVKRSIPATSQNGLLDNDEILGIKGSAADKDNIQELLQGAGRTGAGFSVDIIRYIMESETRTAPKAANPSWTLGDMVSQLAGRLQLDESDAKHKIKGIGVVEAMQISSLADPSSRKKLLEAAINKNAVGLGARVNADYVGKVYRCPARHYSLMSFTAPSSRRMLSVDSASAVTIFIKNKAWWGGLLDDDKTIGWIPSYALHPYPMEDYNEEPSTNDAGPTVDYKSASTISEVFVEAAITDPLYSVAGWWEANAVDSPQDIPWVKLLPDRNHPILRHRATSNLSGSNKEYTFFLTFADNSSSVIRLTLVGAVPVITEEWSAPQMLRSNVTLKRYQTRFGHPLIEFCKKKVGSRVGDGKSWTFIDEALRHVGAQRPGGMEFGQAIRQSDSTEGDIVLFGDCVFTTSEEAMPPSNCGIVKVFDGHMITIWHAGINLKINEATFDLTKKSSGTLKFFRPIPLYETAKSLRGQRK